MAFTHAHCWKYQIVHFVSFHFIHVFLCLFLCPFFWIRSKYIFFSFVISCSPIRNPINRLLVCHFFWIRIIQQKETSHLVRERATFPAGAKWEKCSHFSETTDSQSNRFLINSVLIYGGLFRWGKKGKFFYRTIEKRDKICSRLQNITILFTERKNPTNFLRDQ